MTDFNQLRKEKELINLRESAHYSWRDELNEGSDHPYVDVMPTEKTGDPKKDKKAKKDKEKVEEGWKPLPKDKMMRQSHKAYRKEEDAVNRGDGVEATKQMKRRFAMEVPSSRKAALDNQKAKKKAVKEEALEEGAFKDQYGKKGQLSQSSKRKSLGRGSSIKDGAKPTGYESKSEFRDAAKKFSLKPNTKFRTEEKDEALELVKKSLPKGALIDTKNMPKRQHWSKEHARKDYDPKRYDKKND